MFKNCITYILKNDKLSLLLAQKETLKYLHGINEIGN